jgi:hypothetical protein
VNLRICLEVQLKMKSLISLSVHKAGSSIADRIITEICREKKYAIDLISRQVPHSSLPEGEIYINYQQFMQVHGVYYGMARGPYVRDMQIISKLKAIVQVRDPRDCLTSAYFSFKESHVPPKNPDKLKEFRRRREQILNMTIDEYAKTRAAGYGHRLLVLKDIIEMHDDVLLLKYEDMVDLTESWLEQICSFIGQPMTSTLVERLGQMMDFKVKTEDPSSHKRQVKPGDHLRKLQSETISAMESVLRPSLDYFGYPINGRPGT